MHYFLTRAHTRLGAALQKVANVLPQHGHVDTHLLLDELLERRRQRLGDVLRRGVLRLAQAQHRRHRLALRRVLLLLHARVDGVLDEGAHVVDALEGLADALVAVLVAGVRRDVLVEQLVDVDVGGGGLLGGDGGHRRVRRRLPGVAGGDVAALDVRGGDGAAGVLHAKDARAHATAGAELRVGGVAVVHSGAALRAVDGVGAEDGVVGGEASLRALDGGELEEAVLRRLGRVAAETHLVDFAAGREERHELSLRHVDVDVRDVHSALEHVALGLQDRRHSAGAADHVGRGGTAGLDGLHDGLDVELAVVRGVEVRRRRGGGGQAAEGRVGGVARVGVGELLRLRGAHAGDPVAGAELDKVLEDHKVPRLALQRGALHDGLDGREVLLQRRGEGRVGLERLADDAQNLGGALDVGELRALDAKESADDLVEHAGGEQPAGVDLADEGGRRELALARAVDLVVVALGGDDRLELLLHLCEEVHLEALRRVKGDLVLVVDLLRVDDGAVVEVADLLVQVAAELRVHVAEVGLEDGLVDETRNNTLQHRLHAVAGDAQLDAHLLEEVGDELVVLLRRQLVEGGDDAALEELDALLVLAQSVVLRGSGGDLVGGRRGGGGGGGGRGRCRCRRWLELSRGDEHTRGLQATRGVRALAAQGEELVRRVAASRRNDHDGGDHFFLLLVVVVMLWGVEGRRRRHVERLRGRGVVRHVGRGLSVHEERGAEFSGTGAETAVVVVVAVVVVGHHGCRCW
eukprot:PhM_4_TR8410/c3_g8_i1/m.8147